MRGVIILVLLAVIGFQVNDWGMEANGWRRATEMCQPFGGVVAASYHYVGLRLSGQLGYNITAWCRNKEIIKRYFNPSEYVRS